MNKLMRMEFDWREAGKYSQGSEQSTDLPKSIRQNLESLVKRLPTAFTNKHQWLNRISFFQSSDIMSNMKSTFKDMASELNNFDSEERKNILYVTELIRRNVEDYIRMPK